MRKITTSVLFCLLLAEAASATEPWVKDAHFQDLSGPLFVSKCHFEYELTSQHGEDDDIKEHRFYLVFGGRSGTIIRESYKGFSVLGGMEKIDNRWRVEITSAYTDIMTHELSNKLMDSDFILITPEKFKLTDLKYKTELCGTQGNPRIAYYDNLTSE